LGNLQGQNGAPLPGAEAVVQPNTGINIEACTAAGAAAGFTVTLKGGRCLRRPQELRTFRITQMAAMGTKRGIGRGSFIDSIVDAVDAFYGDVLQNLRAWRPAAPQLREQPESPDIPPALVPTALSSQDEQDTTQPPTTTPSAQPQ
jgi:hypothetical protein